MLASSPVHGGCTTTRSGTGMHPSHQWMDGWVCSGGVEKLNFGNLETLIEVDRIGKYQFQDKLQKEISKATCTKIKLVKRIL